MENCLAFRLNLFKAILKPRYLKCGDFLFNKKFSLKYQSGPFGDCLYIFFKVAMPTGAILVLTKLYYCWKKTLFWRLTMYDN